MTWKNTAWFPPRSNNPPPINLAVGSGIPRSGHKGYWTWEVKPLPEEVRRVGGKEVVVLRSEWTGKRIYVQPKRNPQWP